jgi:hypothetical protein
VEKRAVEVKLGHLLSPELGCTIMWFLRRWSLSYLLPVETYYSEVSGQHACYPVLILIVLIMKVVGVSVRSQDSAVGIATDWMTKGSKFESR